jgi:hypothetical protein
VLTHDDQVVIESKHQRNGLLRSFHLGRTFDFIKDRIQLAGNDRLANVRLIISAAFPPQCFIRANTRSRLTRIYLSNNILSDKQTSMPAGPDFFAYMGV